MTAADDAASSAAAITAGPMREVQVGGSLVTLLGTAHVSRQALSRSPANSTAAPTMRSRSSCAQADTMP